MPSAALVKATLIASATAMEGGVPPPPSNDQGWGRILLDDALHFFGDAKRLYVADRAARFASPADPADLHALTVLDGTEPLRVVLAWTDYPSTPVASINLVNDLDLTVQSPTGTIYRGNVFSAGSSQTGGTADRRNNVEVIRIPNPAPGAWTVRVTPFAVPQPAQGYALIATGRLAIPGVLLSRTSLQVLDSVGGNGNGILEPGEWFDLPLTLANSGAATATNVRAQVASLSPYLEVIQSSSAVGNLTTGASGPTTAPHLRVRVRTDLPCSEAVVLRFTYVSDESSREESVTLPTGLESVFLHEDFEGATGWAHSPADSTLNVIGAWTIGDPEGTGFQPEDDATPAPGVRCLFTATNPGRIAGTDDVDNGVVVARSGSYDLSGHPEARVRLRRWFGNRDTGEDPADYFRLHIRANASSPEVLLEELGTNVGQPAWTTVNFRVASFVPPGPAVQLRVDASDGTAPVNIIEAAVDEIEFWEPACATWNPAPAPVFPLRGDRSASDVALSWSRPPIDPQHGETSSYRVYRSTTPAGGFVSVATVTDASPSLGWSDPGAVESPDPFLAYLVVASNAAGDSEIVP